MQKEAKARIKINKLLEEGGWRFFDNESGRANIALEVNAKINYSQIDAFGEDFEKTTKGYIDFLLLDDRGFPIAVLEAKSEDKNPLTGKEQSRKYAKSQNVRFVILSNGNLHYFWDLERGNPRIITSFPTLESLSHVKTFEPNSQILANENVGEDYIVCTQNPYYDKDPRWEDPAARHEFIRDNDLKFLRPYQLRAIKALQESARQGNDRFLFEMATGTGKTLVAAAIIKLFLRTRNAARVLFLVDRLELEDQAWKSFVKYLRNDYKAVIYKESRDDWKKAEIVVSTVQSLSFNNKYRNLFSPTDFDLLISDEAHRSIGGNSRAVFEYFVGYKLGLTATPKDYLKKIDSENLSRNDPREWERRQLLDTYKTFGCESGNPTFRYSLIDGVKGSYLVNPVVVDARTEITTKLLSDKGYSVMIENEEGRQDELLFFHKDFERSFFSDETNRIFCKTFMEHAFRDPLTGEIGKTIVFCVSQNHAARIAQFLNEYADRYFPDKYKSDFAVQVTSSIADAQQMTINFSDKNNNLSGRTEFLEGYRSSKTRVCVTVGMMTTGYDCQDILNLCMMRPIFSPTDFVQIKGRGTRKYVFEHKSRGNPDDETMKAVKDKFKLFDFFANCEYFEEKFNYDEVIKLPAVNKQKAIIDYERTLVVAEDYENYNPDPLKSLRETSIGVEGMKIDRKLFERFEETVKDNEFIKSNFEHGNIDAVEEYVRSEIFDKPEEYFNLEKLRKALKLDRRLSIREIIENIFGAIGHFKTKDELLEDEISKFVAVYKPDNKHIQPIRLFLKAYITDNEIRNIVESKEYSRFATNPKVSLSDFKALNGWRDVIPEYVKDYVKLNTYM